MWSLCSLFERKWHKQFRIWKILNFIHVHCVTTMQKYLLMAYRRNSLVANHCILIEIDETKWTNFDFIRNDVLQNYLVQFLKYLADNFDNLKFQETRKVVTFRPPNSYILHLPWWIWSLYSLFERKWHEKFKI